MSNPRMYKSNESNEKITFKSVFPKDRKPPTFKVNVTPFPYDLVVMEYIKKFEKGAVDGVHVTMSIASPQSSLEITFSPTADINKSDPEFRNTLIKVSGGTALTSFDREKIIRAYENFLKFCELTSEFTARTHKTPGMDKHGSAF